MPLDNAQIHLFFEQSGVGWPGDDDPALLEKVLRELDLIEAEYLKRFRHRPDPPIADQLGSEPLRLRALIQALASPMTTCMRTMVFCVLDGASVRSLRFEYQAQESARLEISVEYDSGRSSRFESDDLWDAEALRHFGIFKMDNKPVLDGYYPL